VHYLEINKNTPVAITDHPLKFSRIQIYTSHFLSLIFETLESKIKSCLSSKDLKKLMLAFAVTHSQILSIAIS